MTSTLKTGLLLGALTALLLLLGGAAGGQSGVEIAFVIAIVMNVGSRNATIGAPSQNVLCPTVHLGGISSGRPARRATAPNRYPAATTR